MKKIFAKELTPEAFTPYGVYKNLLEPDGISGQQKEKLSSGYFPDLIDFPINDQSSIGVSVGRVTPCDNIIPFLEFHSQSYEGRIPLDEDIVIYVGKAAKEEPLSEKYMSLEGIEAFIVPKGTFVRLNPGVVHGRQFVTANHVAHVMLIALKSTVKYDSNVKRIEKENSIQIIL